MAPVRGSCNTFCPDKEKKMRIHQRILHFFELKNGQKNSPGILVKEFTRSAADVKTPKPEDMRTEAALTKTVEYLLKEIILDDRKPYHVAYDFIFDRLRAVRREIVIQMYGARQSIRLLEPIVMFLAYSRYRLCEESIERFDPKICNQHLQECLTGVLCCYDDLEKEADPADLTLREKERRCLIESLYQIFNLGSPESFARSLTLPAYVRADATFKLCFGMCLAHQQGNLYRVLMGVPKLPHILAALASTKLQALRRTLLLIFTHAYNNKQLTVPAPYLLHLLQLDGEALQKQCLHYGLHLASDRKAVLFNKTGFNSSAEPLKPQHEPFVDSKLAKIYLPEVLLLKRLT
ncbi:hypothetical protein KR018_000197 [Drosophila ironensis]|nr:hypothetical protein KR018_000197 [Drosophila ironensis]